jgi:hypothetical protein
MEDVIHLEWDDDSLNWKSPVPLWVFLIGVIVTASVTSGAFLLPSALGPKPDFVISDFPPMYLHGTNTTLISIHAIRNFTGIVTVTVSSPVGLKTALQDSFTGREKEQILLGKTGNLSLAVDNWQKVGYFSVAVTASSGAISHTQSLIVIVQNITMTAIGGSHLWISRGSSGTDELDFSSVNGLSGNVSFGASVFEGCDASSYCPLSVPVSSASLSPTSIFLSPRGIGTTTLTINVPQSDTSSSLIVNVYVSMRQSSWWWTMHIQVTVT